jgi:peptidoglycan-associated lipoprotein
MVLMKKGEREMRMPRWLFAVAVVSLVAACASDETPPSDQTATGGGSAVPGAATGGGRGVQSGELPGGGSGRISSGAAAEQAQQQVNQVGDTVFFAFDRYDLDDRSQRTLDSQASVLLRFPQVNVIIEGNCDERGTREYNLALGERRANAVKEYLAALGVAPSRMRTISYGDERPLVIGSNEAAWAKNRRAVTVVAGGTAGS